MYPYIPQHSMAPSMLLPVKAVCSVPVQQPCFAKVLRKFATPGKSNDDLAALDVIQKLGARVANNEDGSITIHSIGIEPNSSEINCGESGLGIRMFTPIAALSNKPITINGTGSLLTRPMNFFDEIFS